MTPSNNLYEFIKNEEGCVLHSYRDSAGIWTIGIGSTMYRNGMRVRGGQVITLADAMDLLRWEVSNKATSVSKFTKGVILTQNQYDALVSFAYNVGTGALQSSTLLKKVKLNPNSPLIRNQFMRWNKITKDGKLIVSRGLTARRKREADLYFKQ